MKKKLLLPLTARPHRALSKETKDKIRAKRQARKKLLGYLNSSEARKRISLSHKGKRHSEETRKKMSEAKKREKHWNWQGGFSPKLYPKEFNSELKLKIRTRDNFICCLCGRTEREELDELNYVLCVNHIDYNKNNCKEENLNTLCRRCNTKINRDRDYWTNYFNIL